MTDISELERRISAALDRIRSGVDGMASAPAEPDTSALDALREELDAEKTANAQLEERVKALRQQSESARADVETQLEAAKSAAMEARNEVQQLRKTNQHLQSSLQALREATAAGTSEPHLINQAMQSELDGLRSARDGDRAELDALLGELAPLLKEGSDA